MAQARNETILDKQRLDVLTLQSIFYVVNDNKNYHAYADSILALIQDYINRTTLGIDRVDNTSDANKPISTLVAAALADKAASVDLDALSAQISGLVTEVKHNDDVGLLWQAINSAVGLTPEQVSQMVETVTGPIVIDVETIKLRFDDYFTVNAQNQYAESIQTALNGIFGRLASLEEATGDLSIALSDIQQRVDSSVGDVTLLRGEVEQQGLVVQEAVNTVEGMSTTVNSNTDRIYSLEQKTSGYDDAIQGVQDAVNGFSQQIGGYDDAIQSLQDKDVEHDLKIGANEQAIQSNALETQGVQDNLDQTNERVTTLENAQGAVDGQIEAIVERVETAEQTVQGYSSTIDSIQETNVTIQNEQLSLRADIGDLTTAVFGEDGEPGLVVRMEHAETDIEVLKQDKRDVFQGPHEW